MKRQHHKGKKRPRAWHRSRREDKRWLGHVQKLEDRIRGLQKALR